MEKDHWIPDRLWAYIGSSIQAARASQSEMEWGRVTQGATLFLEHEVRKRVGSAGPRNCSRQDLAAIALKKQTPVLNLQKDPEVQEAWMNFVKGIFGTIGNPAAHSIREHSPAFAMGAVGAVAMVLDTFDIHLGPPPR